MKKRVLGIILVICLLASIFPLSAFAAMVENSSECGSNAVWELDDEGKLTISGFGDMADNDSASDVPWYESKDSIKAVVIESGITGIGAYAFYDCGNITSISIPESVTNIGEFAFDGLTGLSAVLFGQL